MRMPVKRLSDTARLPFRASAGAAGYDLHADLRQGGTDAPPCLIPPGQRVTVPTGIALAIPEGCYGRIAPRSGLAIRGLDVLGGVVDADYRGEIMVILANHDHHRAVEIQHGERIAQLIIERIETPVVELVESLPSTWRGVGGFGSTGR
ncbi:dUTP diphosphatase [Caldovatus aquaticus]|uniref:dUTP diphosphatase n=1 Tax=Caldovatus aquaticus TaxID=2865671 RepID=A0ABS7EYF2_9PROT|nr:dUTP diphosphatase [Caldovatus aquaticus]MBW8268319.1 dUTP diphosphatase [Caldovatus aquaticus]